MSGNTVVTASFGFGVTSVYVFVKPPGGWQDSQPTATLSASDLNGIDQFGASVAISGNTVVVGSPFHLDGGSGAAYVFVAPPGGWPDMTQTAELTVPVRNTIELGMSVAVVGNLVAVGAPLDVIGQTKKGAVFGYLKPLEAGGRTPARQTFQLLL